MEIIPRAGWGAVPPKSKTPLSPSKLLGVTVHWFGSPKAAASHAGCDDLLRSVQRTHMAPGGLGVPSGGADIGYNHAVCPHGYVYELRGFGVKTGANGTSAGNDQHCAIVYMAGVGDTLTDKAKSGLNFLIREWRARGTGSQVYPHKHWTGSTCPGPAVSTWLAAGRPDPNEEEPMQAWEPLWINWYLNDRIGADGQEKPRPKTIGGVTIPEPPYSDRLWDVIKAAEKFRASKPDGSADIAKLKAKIVAAQKALA